MTPKQKAKKYVEIEYRGFNKDIKRLMAKTYLAGYEQGEYDLATQEMTSAWREYTKKFAQRYDLQDADKESK